MNKVVEFLNANPVQYLATVGRDGKDEIALRQNHVNFIVHHGNALLRQSAQRGIQTGHTIGNTAVVLDLSLIHI